MATKHFYRIITESLPQDLKKVLKAKNIVSEIERYSAVFLVVCFAVLCLYVTSSYLGYSNARAEWLKTEDNFAYWSEIANSQKNSPDAYYQASFYAVELGNKGQASGYLQKALQLDPEFAKASDLEKRLDTSN